MEGGKWVCLAGVMRRCVSEPVSTEVKEEGPAVWKCVERSVVVCKWFGMAAGAEMGWVDGGGSLPELEGAIVGARSRLRLGFRRLHKIG